MPCKARFYTDKEGRKRPITEKKGKSRFQGQTKSASWKRSSIKDVKQVAREGTRRKSMEDYKITFHYKNGTQETVPTAARDADDALNLAMQHRKKKGLKPVKIVVKDGVGSILGKITGKIAGEVHSAVEAFRGEHAKGEPEREAMKQVREMKQSEREQLREEFAQTQLDKAQAGNRAAQIWCEKHHIAWKSV